VPNQPKSPIIAGRVPADLKEWVEQHATDTDQTVTVILAAALERYRQDAESAAGGRK
jgi:hypothetical protein